MTELQQWFQHLRQPECVHVLLNPLPTYATAMGVVALVAALVLRSRPAQVVALIVVILGCAAVWPVEHFGHRGYDRVYALSNDEARQWLDVHMERAEDFAFVFYLTAALALAAILIERKWPKATKPLTLLTLGAAIVSVALSGWISHAGGQVRHSEFREGPPPVEAEHHEHDHRH